MKLDYSEAELVLFKKIAAASQKLGVESYIIGGYVRDKIIGRNTKDIDVVCVGDGIALAEETAKQFGKSVQVNIFKTYGTAQIKFDETEIEFVGARKESYHTDSRNPSVVAGTLQDDQLRRDFTINALGISLNENDFGTVNDPFDGVGDIERKLIKTPLEPEKTFIDDPLRMMRAIRFASQLQFSIEENTLQAIAANANRIKIITKERITEELNKILLSKKPSVGFELLYKTG